MLKNNKDLQLQTEYCHLQYNEENYLSAAVLASALFEYFIHSSTNYKFTKSNSDFPLSDAINYFADSKYQYYTKENKTFKKELYDLRDCRNGLVHNNLYEKKYHNSIKKILNFLERELFKGPLGQLNSFEKQHILEVLKSKEMIASDKNLKARSFQRLDDEDFFNLYSMRDKFLFLKQELMRNKELINLDLQNASVSHVDGTSGYVWLSLHSKDNTKHKFEQISLSILATPDSLRIYIDFGGKAFEARRKYLTLFKNPKFIQELLAYKANHDFYIFDVEWYYSILNKQKSSESIIDIQNIDSVLNRLQEDMETKDTITWNKYLLGYIIPRKEIPKDIIHSKILDIASIIGSIKQKIKILK